jgi:drug/metabolite transporter (DMT)-like permease
MTAIVQADAAAANPLLGIVFKISATLMLTVMSTLIKIASSRYPIGEIVFCRSFFALIPLFILVWINGQFRVVFKTANYFGHIKRSLAGTAAIFFNFGALFFLPIADATAISYSMPLVTVILAVFMLGEDVQPYRWAAVAVGFAGIVVILGGYFGNGGFDSHYAVGALLAILGSLAGGMAIIQIRTLARIERPITIVVYFSLLTTLAGLVTAPLGWVVPDRGDAAILVATGIAGGIAQFFTTQAYKHTGASNVAPFEYTSMLWALSASWLVFAVWPTSNVIVGSVIVIVAGIFVAHRDQSRRAVR